MSLTFNERETFLQPDTEEPLTNFFCVHLTQTASCSLLSFLIETKVTAINILKILKHQQTTCFLHLWEDLFNYSPHTESVSAYQHLKSLIRKCYLITGSLDELMDKWMYRLIKARIINGWMDVQINWWVNEWMVERWMDKLMGGFMLGGWLNKSVDGWINGWIIGW